MVCGQILDSKGVRSSVSVKCECGREGTVCTDRRPLALTFTLTLTLTLAPITGFIVRQSGEMICKISDVYLTTGKR
jgi:hypothetical protein